MYQWVALGVTVIVLLLLIVRKPVWLVPLFAAALALEISGTWYPSLGVVSALLGEVSLSTFIGIALTLAAFFRLFRNNVMRRKLSAVFSDPLTIFLLMFLILGMVSFVYSIDTVKTAAEALTLLGLFVVFLSIALLMDKGRALIPFHAIHITALILAPLTFFEDFIGRPFWPSELIAGDTGKVYATFADPDTFARFLILGIVANFIIQIYSRDKSNSVLYMAGLAILLAQLALTFSSAGLITLLIILIAALIFLPNRKAVLWILGLGALGGVMVLLIRPDLWGTMTSFIRSYGITNPETLSGLQEAVAVFQANLIYGTGLGTFPVNQTSVLTIAAELGIIGLAVLSFIWIMMIGRLFSLYNIGGTHLSMFDDFHNEFYVGTGYFLWALTVFINSQMTGQFFEDPILWLSIACLVILRFERDYNVFSD